MGLTAYCRRHVFLRRSRRERLGWPCLETGEAAVETVSEGSGVVRLLEKEPTKAERYAHAAGLLAIIQRTGTPHEPPQQLHRVAVTAA
jgi:hypothetical protein